MKHALLLLALILLMAPAALAQTPPQTRTFSIDCWSDGHCAMPCGGSATGNYDCSDGTGGWTNACAFTDPLPSGARVTKIQATLFTHQCAGSTSLSPTMNGQAIGSVTESRSSCSCLSSPCLDTTVTSGDFPNGFPGYNAGGQNTFGVNVTSGTLCVEHVDITLTYTTAPLTIVQPSDNQDFDLTQANSTATNPIHFEARTVPANATRQVDFNVLLEYATSGGRGTTPDTRGFQAQPASVHDETYTGMGGRLTVNASATINNQTVNAQQVRATITGVALAEATITTRLVDLYRNGDTPRLMTGIAQVESSYLQFRTRTLYGRSDLWPTESFDGGSHMGLMQMPITMAHAWNWETNTADGVDLFQEKLRAAHRIMRRIINANHGLRQLTGVELENMALVLYGPNASADLGSQYYAPAPTPTGGVDWVVNTAGNAGGVTYANNCRGSMH